MKVVLLPPSFYLERSENCPKRKEVTDAAKWYSLPQFTNGGKKATFCSNTPCAAKAETSNTCRVEEKIHGKERGKGMETFFLCESFFNPAFLAPNSTSVF